MIFFGGVILTANSLAHAVITPLRTLAKRCKRLTPFLAAPAALLLTQGEAKSVLTYNIFESAGNVIVQTSGSLDLTGATSAPNNECGANGGIASSFAVICTGPDSNSPAYEITGPSTFNGTVFNYPASSVTETRVQLAGIENSFYIDSAYTSNTPIVSGATFNGTTLAALGFTTTGLIGTWALNGTSESIQVILGAPSPSTAVPGPLPLLGAGAAFGWSRRLRKRIGSAAITPPQA